MRHRLFTEIGMARGIWSFCLLFKYIVFWVDTDVLPRQDVCYNEMITFLKN